MRQGVTIVNGNATAEAEKWRRVLGTHQMLSLKSLALILCSASLRVRALSCAALHSFPNMIRGRKMATSNEKKMATNMAVPMCSLLERLYTSV